MDLSAINLDRVRHWTDEVLHNDRFVSNIVVASVLLATILVVWACLRRVLVLVQRSTSRTHRWSWIDAVVHWLAAKGRELLGWTTLAAILGTIFIGAAYHCAGRDALADLRHWYDQLSSAQLMTLGSSIAALIAIAMVARLLMAIVGRARIRLEPKLRQVLPPVSDTEVVPRWLGTLERYLLALVGFGSLIAATHVLGFSVPLEPKLLAAARLVSIVALARLFTIAVRALVPALMTFGDRQLGRTMFAPYWDRFTRLFPLGQRCLEAAVYLHAATLCQHEMQRFEFVAIYGQRVVYCIGIFFVTRVIVELSQVLLYELFGLYGEKPVKDPRRLTLVPLLHSGCRYLIYFIAGIMVLDVFNQPTQPILAGAGIMGLAVGLGAQSLVTDIVSGLFILFENQYLVGDYVEIGSARGVVESIGVRHTQIRDAQGKLYSMPNGQVKEVINYSKDYINAVVKLQVPANADLDEVLRLMTEAGRILRQSRDDVLAETVVHGSVDLDFAGSTVQAVTKVRPGAHLTVENEYRRILQGLLHGPARIATSQAAASQAAARRKAA